MSYANPEVFPRVLLEHQTIDSTIAVVGLRHVVPQGRAYMYQEVGEFAQARLMLPNSVVHYEVTVEPTEEEKAEFKARRPSTFEKLARLDELEVKWLETLGLVHQTEALYDAYVTDLWTNHDLRDVDWANQVHDEELDQEILEMEDYCTKILVLEGRNKEQYNERNFMLDMEEFIDGCEMTPFDRLREEFAVNAVIEESQQGIRHFTLLWGLGHLANLQTAFEKHGYVPVTERTISVLDK